MLTKEGQDKLNDFSLCAQSVGMNIGIGLQSQKSSDNFEKTFIELKEYIEKLEEFKFMYEGLLK